MSASSTLSLGRVSLGLPLLFATSIACAQNIVIQGHIANSATGQPVVGASVALRGTTVGADTDANGNYRLPNVAPGSYTLGVRLVGYATQERRVEVTDGPYEQNFGLAATQQDLDEVSVTAARNRYHRPNPSNSLRLGEPLLEAPQNVQVVTNQLLADQQIFTPIEGIARNVSGVIAPGHWNNVYARINIRGFNTGFGSLRNGLSTGNYFGPLAEDASFIERVEFVKGPGGFLVSNTEAGGFYNVVLKAPTGTSRKAVGLTLGSFGQYRATADVDGRLSRDNKLQYRLNVMGQSIDSYQGFDFNRKVALAPSLRYLIDDKTTATVQYVYQYSNFSTAGNYLFSPNGYKSLAQDFAVYDPVMGSSRVNDHSLFGNVEHRFSGNWKLTGQVAYLRYAMRGLSTWIGAGSFNPNMSFTVPATNGATPNRTIAGTNVLNRSVFLYDVDNYTLAGQAFLNGTVETGPVQHRIIVGLDVSNKSYAADFGAAGFLPLDITAPVYYGAPPATLLNQDALRDAGPLDRRGTAKGLTKYAGVYVQDELGFFDNRLRLTLAARYSNNNNVQARIKKNVVTPRFGLSATVAPGTAVYALYDQSIVPQTGQDFNGNSFDPQRGRNIEAGLKREWFDGRFNSTITAFNITKTNVLTGDPVNPTFSVQTGEVRSRGIEADFMGELLPGLNLVANYALLDATVTKDNAPRNAAGNPTRDSYEGRKLGGTAKHNSNAWLTYRLRQGALKGLGLSGGMLWQVERYAGLGNAGEKLPDNYFRLDGGVSWQGEHLSLNLLVNNLTGRYNYNAGTYVPNATPAASLTPSAIGSYYYWQPEAPTSYRLTVGYSF
ncbi:MAG TPA: TonB-dependent receptor [Hymenobacter sp.]|uniref:TonB-dependent receptor n=1 Tax=Hymenobacter sp. TaxID=1898978 RepID=UPI002D7E3474|nr:TonB-dependent receptor [Hymenobacter sp.]HET9502472.1 TonB-dependent receptor [Hymenobacter sp.]